MLEYLENSERPYSFLPVAFLIQQSPEGSVASNAQIRKGRGRVPGRLDSPGLSPTGPACWVLPGVNDLCGSLGAGTGQASRRRAWRKVAGRGCTLLL